MASNINPNDIDATYPIAGQDNDSQGFRDNFTNIKTNFQYAENEISDLQSKVILKAALSGGTLDNNMAGALLYAAKIQGFTGSIVSNGALSGSVTLNYSAGHFQTITTTGSISLAFQNFPAAGAYGLLRLQITVSSVGHTLTLPTAVTQNNAGIQGINASNIITFAAAGTYTFDFSTSNGGATYIISQTNEAFVPLNSSAEDLAPLGSASLATSASYFTTAASESATLSAGVAGQVKTFAMYGYGGNMVITVSNAGWKSSGSGTMTFTAIGQACTLQYINSKWFCIGNNGATFA